MKLSIQLPSNRFLAGETIPFTVRLTNDGAAPVDVPDPDDGGSARIGYEVTGPAYPEPAAFPRGKRAIVSASMSVQAIPLAPGASIDYEVELERLVPFSQPGDYSISTTMTAAGGAWKAEVTKITVEHPKVRSARIMADDGFQSAATQRVLVMFGNPGRLYQMMFRENRPAIGEIKRSGLVTVDTTPLPPEADGLYAPWAKFNRGEIDQFRVGWTSPKTIGIESSEEPGSAVTFAVPAQGAPVHPPFLLENGDVLAWVRTAKALQLVRFPVPGAGQAKVDWEAPLEGPPVTSAVATLSREGDIAYAMTCNGPSVTLFRAGSKPEPVEIPDALPLPDSEPTLWVDAEGKVHGALLVQEKSEDDEETLSFSFVRITWGDDDPVIISRTRVFSVPADNAPVASRVCHSIANAGAFRVDWIVVLKDGRVLSRTTPNTPQVFSGKPVLPLQLLPMSVATYLLTYDDAEVLKFWKVN